jgi:hypothetical protein
MTQEIESSFGLFGKLLLVFFSILALHLTLHAIWVCALEHQKQECREVIRILITTAKGRGSFWIPLA